MTIGIGIMKLGLTGLEILGLLMIQNILDRTKVAHTLIAASTPKTETRQEEISRLSRDLSFETETLLQHNYSHDNDSPTVTIH